MDPFKAVRELEQALQQVIEVVAGDVHNHKFHQKYRDVAAKVVCKVAALSVDEDLKQLKRYF